MLRLCKKVGCEISSLLGGIGTHGGSGIRVGGDKDCNGLVVFAIVKITVVVIVTEIVIMIVQVVIVIVAVIEVLVVVLIVAVVA